MIRLYFRPMAKKNLLRWLPALLIMAVIFLLSNTPSKDLPDFGLLDFLVKKAGHMAGYGLLALAYWFGLRFEKRYWWLPILLAVIYAASDEFHQSFIAGRNPSLRDVFLFDGGGASLTIALAYYLFSKKIRNPFRPGSAR